jgi:sugar phosphate isomerase/epimerase
MQIQIFAAHWGNNELEPQVFIDRVKAAGFDGIEMSLPLDVAAARRLDAPHRRRRPGPDRGAVGDRVPPDFDAQAALAELLHNACAAKPLHINSHTGKDFFTPEQNRELLDLAADISRQHGVPIYHEIHRSRFSGHPMLLLPYLQQMPDLQLTADLSHWCCACESLLEDQPETLARPCRTCATSTPAWAMPKARRWPTSARRNRRPRWKRTCLVG